MNRKSPILLFPLAFIILAGLMPIQAVNAEETAADLSPEGYWQTVPDDDGSPSVIHIWIENGQAFGKVIKIYPKPGKDPEPICDECEGELKDKPVIGMTILNNLAQKNEKWSGGTILDPNNGKTYKCHIKVMENGEKLKVRGYIGMSALGRTQYWNKVSRPE
jgi:uncharacterized protein (DUF2147 family)